MDDERWQLFEAKQHLHRTPRSSGSGQLRLQRGGRARTSGRSACSVRHSRAMSARFELLRPPEVSYDDLIELDRRAGVAERRDDRLRAQVRAQVEVHANYAGYIERQQEEIERQRRNEETRASGRPRLRARSRACRTRCGRSSRGAAGDPRPGRAHSGVTPAAVSILLVHLKKRSLARPQPPRSHERASSRAPRRSAWGARTTRWFAWASIRKSSASRAISPASASPIFHFNKAIIDATADLVCAYKPQFAHYAAYEAEDQLERTIEYIHQRYPDIPVILDSKRGDVGNTAERYAIEAFERYGADAVTVNPYLGGDSLEPFLRLRGQGRDRSVPHLEPRRPRSAGPQGRRARRSTRWWPSSPHSAGTRAATASLVVGATYPQELAAGARARGRHAAPRARRGRTGRRCGAGGARGPDAPRAPDSSSAPRAPSSTPRRARTSRARRARRPWRCATEINASRSARTLSSDAGVRRACAQCVGCGRAIIGCYSRRCSPRAMRFACTGRCTAVAGGAQPRSRPAPSWCAAAGRIRTRSTRRRPRGFEAQTILRDLCEGLTTLDHNAHVAPASRGAGR